MKTTKILIILLMMGNTGFTQDFHKDIIPTLGGDLAITFIGHGTLMFEYQGKTIHIDPWSQLADYSKLPRADVILITHEHPDHLDPKAIQALNKENTELYVNRKAFDQIKKGKVLKNGDFNVVAGFPLDVVPAYNTYAKRGNGQPYHPKGDGNGYILTFADVRVYVAGDTDYYPEMKDLKEIDVAFLPMNLPYTMAPEMVAICAKAIEPKILYPYHFGETNPEKLSRLLMNSGIEVRVRAMK